MVKWYTTSYRDFAKSIELCEARSQFMLPMACCPRCQDRRGFPEVEYPNVDPEQVFDKHTLSTLLEKKWPRSDWPTFVSLRDKLRTHLPDNAFVAPACGFGTIWAKVFKHFEGFGFAGMGRLVASVDAFAAITDAGFDLRVYAMKVRQSGAAKGRRAFFVYVPLSGAIPPGSGITICPVCSRPSRPSIEGADEWLVAESAPTREPVFRLSYSPAVLMYREDFVEFIKKKLMIRKMEFLPVRTI